MHQVVLLGCCEFTRPKCHDRHGFQIFTLAHHPTGTCQRCITCQIYKRCTRLIFNKDPVMVPPCLYHGAHFIKCMLLRWSPSLVCIGTHKCHQGPHWYLHIRAVWCKEPHNANKSGNCFFYSRGLPAQDLVNLVRVHGNS